MPTPRVLPLVLAVVAAFALQVGDSRATGASAWRAIVNPSNPASSVERRFLSDVFLKKVSRWPTGEGVRPVDLREGATTRQRFSEDVLERSVASVKSYWAQLVFSGRDVPPPELDNDDEVVRFVLKNVGAIGYVSPGAATDRAKTLTVR